MAGNKVSAYVAKANIGVAPGRFSNWAYSSAGGFNCTFSDGSPGQAYRIQSTPSLAPAFWTDLTNFTYSGPTLIVDPGTLPATNTFYRAVAP